MERRLEGEKQTTGADLPLLAGLISARQQRELKAVQDRLAEIDELLARCREAQRLAALPSRDTWEHARRFDAVREQVGVSFVWGLDFAEVFDPQDSSGDRRAPGFDVIVGNPPFVTSRHPELRERYRRRWPTSCYKKYHLLAPFTELALLKLLRPQGQLGYIVSNAFATRDFGKPLVEEVFRRVELLNVVDCSGLMFPGHGTPTCVLLGHAIPGDSSRAAQGRRFIPGCPAAGTLLCGTSMGMGQLREEPEETELWREIESGWETPDFLGDRVAVADIPPNVTRTHPWSLNAGGANLKQIIDSCQNTLEAYLSDEVGVATMTNSDEIFDHDPSHWRRVAVDKGNLRTFVEGPEIRDWEVCIERLLLAPYDQDHQLLSESTLGPATKPYLEHFRTHLENRHSFASKTFKELGRPWYEFERWNVEKYRSEGRWIQAFIATHVHVFEPDLSWALNRHSQAIPLMHDEGMAAWHIAALLNSSAALFWLKQVCFCKRYSGSPETDDYYEFAGGKVQQLPVPSLLLEDPKVKDRASTLVQQCSDLGAWRGNERFALTPNQARVVELLDRQRLAGVSALSQAYILETLEIGSQNLGQVFRRSPAWDRLVMAADGRGMYRLNVSPQ